MKLADTGTIGTGLGAAQRETREKYPPLILVVALAWFAARGLRKLFWTALGLYWAFHAVRF